ncbi:MAG: hypothetical protein QNJ14_07440 [Woeseiaceae bacterium]|nr:hypothetical protein [Woeseiaceae bacterium]
MKDVLVSGASPVLMPREDPAGKIVFVVILATVIIVSFTALMTLLAALFRGQTGRARDAIADAPYLSLLTGLVGWGVFAALAAWCYSRAFVHHLLETEILPGYLVAAAILLIVPLFVCLLGAPGLYTQIGRRVAALRASETSDLACVVIGTLVALAAVSFPGFGWFIVLPLLLFAEFGAGARSLLR